jgi:hypothetical protein
VKIARLGMVFTLVTCTCIFVLEFFSDVNETLVGTLTWGDVHLFFTYGGFGCMTIAVIIYRCVFTKDNVPRFGRRRIVGSKKSLPPHFIVFGVIVATGVSQLVKLAVYPNAGWNGPGFTSISFWEWMLMFAILLYVFWIGIILPEEMPSPP